jgi:DNA-binding response OmpR family regulator
MTRRTLVTPAFPVLAASPCDEGGDLAVRVLVVEDEAVLANAVARGLRREGMAVDVAFDGADALEKAGVNRYEVIVLDRDLPVVHGDAVCRRLAAQGAAGRILMLTAAGAVDDRVSGLNLGADDYLGKPFAFSELVARVRALGRRSGEPTPPVLARHDVVLDRARREARRGGRGLQLTRKELGVLEVLLAAEGAVVSSEELLERVWDENADPFTHTVRVTVMHLRRKLGQPPLIDTVIGAGYRL